MLPTHGRLGGAVLLWLVALGAPAQELFSSDREYLAWMHHYYFAPRPERIIPGVLYYAESSMFKRDKRSRVPMAHFYARLLRREPFRARQLYDVLLERGTDRARMLSLHIFWLMDAETGRELMDHARGIWTGRHFQQFLDRYGSAPPPRPLDQPVSTTESLDILWSVFFATGNAEAVRKITDVAPLGEHGAGADAMLGGAAEWSLIRNAQQHVRVRELLAHEMALSTGAKRAVLERVLARSE